MIVRVVAVGSVKGPLAQAAADYRERAGRYWKLEVEEVPSGAPGRKADPDRVRDEEGRRLLERVGADDEVVALTRKGKAMGSKTIARYLQDRAVGATPAVTFLIGGAFGLSPAVLQRARRSLSLSAATFPHDLARVVLLEQIYRAGTILRNEPYHKG